MVFTGIFGRSPLMSVQADPVFVVMKTWPRLSPYPEKPEKVTYAVVATLGSPAIAVMERFGRLVVLLILAHVAEVPERAFVVTWRRTSLDPA